MKSKYFSYLFGILAEYYTAFVLFFKGYIPIKHRYKTKLGEIDLIFRKGHSIIAVEVKARSSEEIRVGEVVQARQFYRILNCLKIFLNKNEKYSNFDIMIDVVLVHKNLGLEHIKNVWIE